MRIGTAFLCALAAFAADPEKPVLLGHSLAGQFALRLLCDHPGRFRVTGAISPSIWWARPDLLAALEAMPDDGRAVFMGAVGKEEPAEAVTDADERRAPRLMVSNLSAAAAVLARRLGPSRTRSAVAAGEDHPSALPALLPRFLRFATSMLGNTPTRAS